MVAQSVVHIDTSRQPYKVVLESGLKFNARTVVIAAGAQYARLPIEDAATFTDRESTTTQPTWKLSFAIPKRLLLWEVATQPARRQCFSPTHR